MLVQHESCILAFRINSLYNYPRLIFTSISKLFYQLNDNHDYLNYFERLYTLQDKLYTDPHQRDIKLHIQNLKTFDFKENFVNDNIFQFKKLHIQNQDYSLYFYDE
ncbi:TPA: hypothetical protein R6B24_000307 [Campylobacter coli]|uniref:hypothetical protein n=2 Tax=Campylobacter coli TaxID=195 RepID=UPI00156DEDDE|nr:hypothetical protein [Campylobacter coli]HED7897051.1 hypothetical protein [Campylobacter coli]HED7905777.1 hypothetical protein [Campylobacter coli]HED7917065.1 hypothetical protein [Campylobacter coli]HED7918972.1 hypothetical protein [Campylobacter coli]HED7930239.1 hypothetical protein [Campylobacter coli]